MKKANSSSKANGIEAFLDHGEGEGAKFLKVDFKDQDEYKVWLHPKSEIEFVWRCVWRSLNSDKTKVKLFRWNSMEDPKILEKQRYKNDDGTYERSPKIDPFMLLTEWVNTQINAGNIDWCDEIFKWEPDGDGDDVVVHAGGFTGKFQDSELTKEERKEMRTKAGMTQANAFMENAAANEETVVVLVDNDNPENGPQIATLKRGIKKQLQKCIKDRRTSFGKDSEDADPFKNPVCFCIQREETDSVPKIQYTVTALTDKVAPLTDEIQAAFDMDPPDTSKMSERSNVALLRKNFEESWCHDVVPPWDEIFEAAEKEVEGTEAAELPEDFNHGANKKTKGKKVEEPEDDDDDAEEEDDKPEVKEEKKPSKPAPKEEPEEETETKEEDENATHCESCDGVLEDSLFEDDPDSVVCPHCGVTYDNDRENDDWVLRKPKKEEKPKVKASRRPRD